MSPAGYSGTPLPRKLGIREGASVGTRRAPAHLADLLDPLPEGARVVALRSATYRRGPRRDVVLLFVEERGRLEREFPALVEHVDVGGGLWVCWPKMASPLFRELREGDVRGVGLAEGLVDNKVCAVDDDWSGLRFVFRKDDRPALREKRKDEA